MKRILPMLFIFIAVSSLISCGQKNPPTRVGAGSISPSVNWQYDTFADILNDCEVYAEVEIIEWLKEDPNGVYTLFNANVQKLYKGQTELEGTKIKLSQAGSSKQILEGFPLFGIGDKLLVGLDRDVEDEKDSYYIKGGNLTVCRIGEDKNGKIAVGYHVAMKNLCSDFSEISVDSGSDSAMLSLQVKKEAQSELNRYQKKIKGETVDFLYPSVAIDITKLEKYIKENI